MFDGAAPEALAKKHGVSVTDVNQAWFDCREKLSRHFAEKERFEYRLLNDNELQARVTDAIRMLLDWREALLHAERFEELKRKEISVEAQVEDANKAGRE